MTEIIVNVLTVFVFIVVFFYVLALNVLYAMSLFRQLSSELFPKIYILIFKIKYKIIKGKF